MEADDSITIRSVDPVAAAARQDIGALSVEELHARITALEAEIVRTRGRLDQAVSHRASADLLFRR